MNFPEETLKTQLEAAYLAIETFARERTKSNAAFEEMQAKFTAVQTELNSERAKSAEQGKKLTELRLAYDMVVETLANATVQLNASQEHGDALAFQHAQVSKDLDKANAELTHATKPGHDIAIVADKDAQLELLRRELAASAVLLAEADGAQRHLAHTLSGVYASRSWRVTKPLRAASGVVRGVPSAFHRTGRGVVAWVRRNVPGADSAAIKLRTWVGAGRRGRLAIRQRSPDR